MPTWPSQQVQRLSSGHVDQQISLPISVPTSPTCDGLTQTESCWNVHQDTDSGKGSSLHGVCLTLGHIKNSLATKHEMHSILTHSQSRAGL